ncbi:amino acid ABC transporter permease [Ferrovibrio xuzhouensis]|uniref:Amino acid ABC transporter permease n=1 Tax=Ferrovibrio xuzhouensis TaxID=1576914 RepID=A0ABV7VIE9_9PROT
MASTTESMAPPNLQTGPIAWVRERLFSSPLNAILTILSIWLLAATIPPIIEWGLIQAHFTAATSAECRGQPGACWAFIGEKYRLIFFGLYPYAEQWRPLIAGLILIGMIIVSCMPSFWKPRLLVIWIVGLVAVGVLMWGGILGLRFVEDTLWGGLPLTLILATFGIAIAFPFGLILAMGRRSKMPAIKTLCIMYIELIRGVPLISMLFMSSVMLPLFLPEGFSIDKLLRAQIAIIMFAAAYIAEVVRGGLQAIPKGQYEGADSLGLSYGQKMGLVVLPQALKVVIPPMVGLFIAAFKDTSLVVIIGIYDLMQSTKVSLTDPAWRGFSIEAYVFIAFIYFIFCFSMSKYSKALEDRLATGHKR